MTRDAYVVLWVREDPISRFPDRRVQHVSDSLDGARLWLAMNHTTYQTVPTWVIERYRINAKGLPTTDRNWWQWDPDTGHVIGADELYDKILTVLA